MGAEMSQRRYQIAGTCREASEATIENLRCMEPLQHYVKMYDVYQYTLQ